MARASPKKPVVELCWTLVGVRQGRFWYARRVRGATGEPAQVVFDGLWALQREEQRGDVVGFYHTHPDGPCTPSRRDERTMHAWTSSFGKPLLCVIESPGDLVAYRFDPDHGPGCRLGACERLARGIVLACE